MEMKFDPILDTPKKHIIIAGPCSAESEEQVMTVARALAADGGIDLFRSGIWKPRTRPNSFEGVGAIGLPWMKRVKEETGLKTTIEVAKRDHVYEALKFGIDVLWIGARTTVNPFAVQEIADALKGVNIPVLVKNPINPDLNLWIGAIERIFNAGITKIGVIHRGFAYHGKTPYRNVPRWQIPIELKRRFPNLPIICDNSHICGRRDTLFDVAQKSIDLNFDGLMTETHPDPDNAWSDAKQQITPATYLEMMNQIIYREVNADLTKENISHMRREIDEIDDDLLNLLGRRMKISEQIGHYKKENNVAILQSGRWNEILQQSIEKGKLKGLSSQFIENIYREIHQASINLQEKVMRGDDLDS